MWVCRKEGAAVFCQRAEFFLKVRLCLRSAWCWWEGGRGRSELRVTGVKLIKDFAGKLRRELIRLSGNSYLEAHNWKLAGGKIRGGFLLRAADQRRWRYDFHNQHCQGVWITVLGPSAWFSVSGFTISFNLYVVVKAGVKWNCKPSPNEGRETATKSVDLSCLNPRFSPPVLHVLHVCKCFFFVLWPLKLNLSLLLAHHYKSWPEF